MRVLVCGAGDVATQLLKQMGETWDVVLIEIEKRLLQGAAASSSCVSRTVAGDASSPVVLEEAGIEVAEYVLALTGSDKVNLAIVDQARKKGVRAILALVHEQIDGQQFRDRGVRVIAPGRLVAQNIYHYLQDPRIKVHPLDMILPWWAVPWLPLNIRNGGWSGSTAGGNSCFPSQICG